MEKIKKTDPSHFLLPGCMFIGIGLGFLFNAIPAGLMVGLGTGLLLSGIVRVFISNNTNNGKTI